MGDAVSTDGLTRILFDDGLGNRSQRVSADAPLPVDIGGSTPGNPTGGVITTQTPDAGAVLTKTVVTMTGVSATLLAANTARLVVIVANAFSNDPAALEPTNSVAVIDEGIPLGPGSVFTAVGKAAQAAMRQIGTNGQKLTVYTG